MSQPLIPDPALPVSEEMAVNLIQEGLAALASGDFTVLDGPEAITDAVRAAMPRGYALQDDAA